jgi:hypothetical protein
MMLHKVTVKRVHCFKGLYEGRSMDIIITFHVCGRADLFYLFICAHLTTLVSSSDYIASNNKMINEG